MTTTYTLQVNIDTDLVAFLQKQSYNLCITKYVQSDGGSDSTANVIWYGGDYIESNTFEWTESYQIYITQATTGSRVSASSNTEPIQGGQSCEFDGSEVTTPTGTPNAGQPFTLTNTSDSDINVGVNCQSTIGGIHSFMPIFVSVELPDTFQAQLTPVNKVTAVFTHGDVTGTMIDTIVGPKITVSYENGVTTHTVEYIGTVEHPYWNTVN
jgi:hypothetical protein